MAAGSTAIPYAAQNASVVRGPVVLLGRLFFAAIFLTAGPNHFTKQAIGYAASQGVPLASIAVPVSGLLATDRRAQHSAGLSRESRRVAHHALSNSRYLFDAQVLDCKRSNDGASPDDHVHEEHRNAWWRVADFSVWGGTVEP